MGITKKTREEIYEFIVKYIENLKNDEKIYDGLLLVLGGIE